MPGYKNKCEVDASPCAQFAISCTPDQLQSALKHDTICKMPKPTYLVRVEVEGGGFGSYFSACTASRHLALRSPHLTEEYYRNGDSDLQLILEL